MSRLIFIGHTALVIIGAAWLGYHALVAVGIVAENNQQRPAVAKSEG